MKKIKDGYKKTEVGIIPEIWKVKKISEFTEIMMGQSPSGDSYNSDRKGVPLLNGPTEFGSIYPHAIQWTTKPTKICDAGDILFCVRGSSTGRMNISNDRYCIGRGLASIRSRGEISDTKFIYYLLQYNINKLLSACTGSTFPNINKEGIGNLKTGFPSLQEQQRITEILSATDENIEKLDMIIEDYELLKKGIMKKLLTEGIGHTEFKESEIGRIPKQWKKVALGKMGNTFNGLSGVKKDDFGSGKPYIPYKNIFLNTKIDVSYYDYVDISDMKKQNLVQLGDIFFTTSSETPEEAGMSSVLLDEVGELYLNSFCFGYRLNNFDTLRPEFARYLLRGDYVRKEIQKLAQGSTRFNLSKGNVMKIEVALPPIEEQVEIAEIISSIEDRIKLFAQEREDFTQLKNVLMQKLLTGKIRVNQ